MTLFRGIRFTVIRHVKTGQRKNADVSPYNIQATLHIATRFKRAVKFWESKKEGSMLILPLC
jgi:hypothetical protein